MSNEKKLFVFVIFSIVLVIGITIYNKINYNIYFNKYSVTKGKVLKRYTATNGRGYIVKYLYRVGDVIYEASYHSSKNPAYPEKNYYVVYSLKKSTKNIFIPIEYNEKQPKNEFTKKELMKHIGGTNLGKAVKKGNWRIK